jgi:hypothetical protein
MEKGEEGEVKWERERKVRRKERRAMGGRALGHHFFWQVYAHSFNMYSINTQSTKF